MNALADMRAIVLAAGLGKRMRPLTDTLPKPMIEVGPRRLIDHVLDWLQEAGIRDVVVNTHYLAPLLETHLRQRTQPRITLSHEETLLETGGGIVKALPLLGNAPFFAANSDTICLNGREHALARLLKAWNNDTMDALLLLHPVEKAVGYYGTGDFFVDATGAVIRKGTATHAPYVFTGIQLLHPRLFRDAPQGAFSMNLLYDRGREDSGRLPRVKAIVHDGAWLHVGEPSVIPLAAAQL